MSGLALYGLVGAGGFGREVMPLVRAQLASQLAVGTAELVLVVDAGPTEPVNGVRVIHTDTFLAYEGRRYFNIAIAGYESRERIARRLLDAGAIPFEVRASNVVELDANTIGEGAILCPFVTITSNARIGRFFHANIYSYVAHDCVVGDFVTFAPRVHCNGSVVIEDYAYIGTGAVLRQGTPDRPLVIGRGAVVGMGAVVTKSVAPGTTVVGNPAAPLVRTPP